MFRELLRKNRQLSDEECVSILINETRGVLSVLGDDGYPYGVPMNHYYNCDDGCIYFHCGKHGHRIDAIKNWNKVSFCVYDRGFRQADEWAYTVKSVIVFGKVEIIENTEKTTEITKSLSYKFTQDMDYIANEIKSSVCNTILIKLSPEHICGKIVKEA